jgi:DNA mismatch endonuclease (patch repair protein)
MARIRAKDTQPELLLRGALWRRGLRGYRLNVKSLPGRPDVAWRRYRIAIFVDGAFWHGHPSAFKAGKSGEYWDKKIRRNMERDRSANAALQNLGWIVLRFWDFDVQADVESCVDAIARELKYRGGENPGAAA